MTFNQLQSNRLNGILYGILQLLFLTLFLFQFYTSTLNITERILILVICMAILFLFIKYFRLCQVIEKIDQVEFITYWKVGPWKLKQKQYIHRDVDPIILIQDQSKYYCVTIQLENGSNVLLEKYPTLDNATSRLNEFKQTLLNS